MATTLRTLLGSLSGVVPGEPLATPRGLDIVVGDIAVVTPVGADPVSPGDVVAAIGVAATDLPALLERLASLQPAVVLVRAVAAAPECLAAASDAGVALVQVPDEVAWADMLRLTQALLADSAHVDLPGVDAAGDLFALADYVADVLGTPVVIEDHQFSVLAFSSGQDDTDVGRAATILGRRVPEEVAQQIRQSGVLQRLLDSSEPVVVPPAGAVNRPHLAMTVRAGGVPLGFLSVTVEGEPTERLRRGMVESAGLVALGLLRRQHAGELDHGARAQQLTALFTGGRRAANDAMNRLGLPHGGLRVLAARVRADDSVDTVMASARLRDVLRLELAAYHVPAATALVDGTPYVVLAARDPQATRELAERIVGRLAAQPRVPEAIFGLGAHVEQAEQAGWSRGTADEVLQYSRDTSAGLVAVDDVHRQLWFRRLGATLPPDVLAGANLLERLAHHDRDHATDHVRTVHAWLDAMGDVAQAATSLGVHSNTVRYRLPRIEAALGVPLTEPDVRLELALRLRLATDAL